MRIKLEGVNDWGGCMVTATPHKVRVRRPLSESTGEGHR